MQNKSNCLAAVFPHGHDAKLPPALRAGGQLYGPSGTWPWSARDTGATFARDAGSEAHKLRLRQVVPAGEQDGEFGGGDHAATRIDADRFTVQVLSVLAVPGADNIGTSVNV